MHPVTRRQRSVPHGSYLLEMVVLVNERNTEENPMTMTPTDEITEDNFIATALHNAVADTDGVLVVFHNGNFAGGPTDQIDAYAAALEEVYGENQIAHIFDADTVAGWIAAGEQAGDWHVAIEHYRRAIAA